MIQIEFLFNCVVPFRNKFISLLKPSDIINFLRATGCRLDDWEKNKYITVWRELFQDDEIKHKIAEYGFQATLVSTNLHFVESYIRDQSLIYREWSSEYLAANPSVTRSQIPLNITSTTMTKEGRITNNFVVDQLKISLVITPITITNNVEETTEVLKKACLSISEIMNGYDTWKNIGKFRDSCQFIMGPIELSVCQTGTGYRDIERSLNRVENKITTMSVTKDSGFIEDQVVLQSEPFLQSHPMDLEGTTLFLGWRSWGNGLYFYGIIP